MNNPETVIEKVRREVAERKGIAETIPPLPAPQKKSMLQKAAAALERAKAKHLKARKWPRLLRPLRRNQESINEALLAAAEALLRETEQLSRITAPLAAQQSNLVTRVQREAEQLRALSKRVEENVIVDTDLLRPALPAECTESFYVAFEDEFRGTPDLIRERLTEYVPYLKTLSARIARPEAVDLGCGRGEWLGVLKESGFYASGVDLNTRMVEICRDAGFEAAQKDALECLRALPDASLALVSGFHIVEHLEFTRLLALMKEAYRVLAPGGMAIFETPNPECQRVSSYTFYMDPTHRNPVPMELLSFIATHAGFSSVQVQRLHPYCEDGKLQAYGDYAGIFTK